MRRPPGKKAQRVRGRSATEDVEVIREGDLGNGPAETWSLLKHSPGQEPKTVGLEELYRLRREAGNADSLAEELFLVEL
ncbi:hypothetical protein JXD38_08795 [candidate division WOR-3 bacterium]|nr:hypothetical protein [candidate division WOR-3 bacterium]